MAEGASDSERDPSTDPAQKEPNDGAARESPASPTGAAAASPEPVHADADSATTAAEEEPHDDTVKVEPERPIEDVVHPRLDTLDASSHDEDRASDPPDSPEPTVENTTPRAPPFYEKLLALPSRAKIAIAAGAAVCVCAITVGLIAHGRGKTEGAQPNASASVSNALVENVLDASLDANVASATNDAVIDAGPPAPPAWRVSSLKNDKTIEYIEGRIGKRPFVSALAHAPLPKIEIARILKAFEDVHTFDRCQPTDAYVLAKDKSTGRVLAFEYAPRADEIYQAREEDGTLHGKKLNLRIEHKPKLVSFVVQGDLKKSLKEANVEDDALKLIEEALEGHVEISDVRAGAKLSMLLVEERIEGDFTRYSDLEALSYIADAAKSEELRVYHYERAHAENEHVRAKDKLAGFYDAKGQRPYRGGFRSPIPFARVTSRFNPHRLHPVLHVVMPHNGIDFAASPGTPVYASAAGVVKFASDSGPCGNMVQIEHSNGIVTAYCHLSKFAPGIHPGLHVDVRQLIGFSGATGRVTGPHLHFAAKRGDMFIDPSGLRLDGVRVIPPQDHDAFQLRRVELDKRLDAISPRNAANDADGGDAGATTDDEIMDTVDVPDAG